MPQKDEENKVCVGENETREGWGVKDLKTRCRQKDKREEQGGGGGNTHFSSEL